MTHDNEDGRVDDSRTVALEAGIRELLPELRAGGPVIQPSDPLGTLVDPEFELDSLDLIELVSWMEERRGWSVDTALLGADPTWRDLLDLLTRG